MKSAGVVLWLILPVEVAAMSVLSPYLDSWEYWVLGAIGIGMTAWLACYLSLSGRQLHRGIAIVVVVLGVFSWRRAMGIVSRIRSTKRKKRAQELMRKRPRLAESSSDLFRAHRTLLAPPLSIVWGYDGDRRPVSSKLDGYHTLIGGATGGGKTNLIQSMLIQLFGKSRIDTEVHIIDLKGDRAEGLYRWGAICNYVDDIDAALKLLGDLLEVAQRRNRDPSLKRHDIVVFIDELATLTMGSVDRENRTHAMRALHLLASKARSARIWLVAATQYPRYDVIDKNVSINFGRVLCLPVKTGKQLEVVLGFAPDGKKPETPGEFILSDGLSVKRGRAFLVRHDEVERIILRHVASVNDDRLELWCILAAGKKIGDAVDGINKTYEKHKVRFQQDFVRYGYRHLAEAGALEAPVKRGEPYRAAIDLIGGVALVREYIKAGKWNGTPEAYVEV